MPGEVLKSDIKMEEARENAQIMAMTAMEHGHRITQLQQNLLSNLSPERRKKLKEKSAAVSTYMPSRYVKSLYAGDV